MKMIRLLIVMLMLATAIAGYSQSPRREPAPAPAPLRELGTDDGFAYVLFYGGDIDGNLEMCS